MDRLLENFLNFSVLAEAWPTVLQGFGLTVLVSLQVIVLGVGSGLGLAVLRSMQLRVIDWLIVGWVDLFRTLPQLVIIIVLYFGMPYLGLTLSPFVTTVLALASVLSAFSCEIFCSAIYAVPRGQSDAARALGFGPLRLLFKIILPQALRLATPMLTNRAISISKGTALGTAVSLPETLGQAQSFMSMVANPSPLTLAAALYLTLFLPLVIASRWIEYASSKGRSAFQVNELLENFANLDSLIMIYPLLLQGVQLSVMLAIVALPLAILAGLVIAVLYSFEKPWLRGLLLVWIDLFRSFPVVVLLVLIYFGLPFFGLKLNGFTAVVLALVLNNSGYYGEIFRAGLNSVPNGQREAARALGFKPLRLVLMIVLPQAIRNVLAPLASNSLELIKTTSIGSMVAIPELLRSARVAQEQTYNPTPLMAAAVIFFCLLWPMARWVARLERRMLVSR